MRIVNRIWGISNQHRKCAVPGKKRFVLRKYGRQKVIVPQALPNFKQTIENVENLHQFLRRVTPSQFFLAIEFRSARETEIIRQLGEQFQLVHCVDSFKKNLPVGEIRYRIVNDVNQFVITGGIPKLRIELPVQLCT